MTDLKQRLQAHGIPCVAHCGIKNKNSFHIGGSVSLAVFPTDAEQLIAALVCLRDAAADYTVVGKGSNLLFPDGEYAHTVVFTEGCRGLQQEDARFTADAGLSLAVLSKKALEGGLSGVEFAAGIPGTVGGAVVMNAGAFGGCMADATVWTEYWDKEKGECRRLYGEEQSFGTRSSVFQSNPAYTVLRCGIELRADDPQAIAERMEDFRRRRAERQPLQYPSAGSVFRHPVGHFAGKLIEDCGLKGTRIGGAEVSTLHAGFIVNRGGATERDVLTLIELIRSRVLKETGIRLECELRRLGDLPI